MYDFFDDVICINLDISEDRRQHAQDIFDHLQIPARFFTATKHKNGGMYGCFDSHIQIIQDAYKRNLNNIWFSKMISYQLIHILMRIYQTSSIS